MTHQIVELARVPQTPSAASKLSTAPLPELPLYMCETCAVALRSHAHLTPSSLFSSATPDHILSLWSIPLCLSLRPQQIKFRNRRAASQYCVSKGMQILVVFSSSVSALYFVFLIKLKAAHQAKEHCTRHQERTWEALLPNLLFDFKRRRLRHIIYRLHLGELVSALLPSFLTL